MRLAGLHGVAQSEATAGRHKLRLVREGVDRNLLGNLAKQDSQAIGRVGAQHLRTAGEWCDHGAGDIDQKNRVLYWTDRGDPPRGNTVNRASIDAKPQAPEIVLSHLMEGIGIALDVPRNRMFVSDFGGSLYVAELDGSKERTLLYAQGNLTGVALADL